MPCVWFVSELQRLIRNNWTWMSTKLLGACKPEKRSKDQGRSLWFAGAWDALSGPDCRGTVACGTALPGGSAAGLPVSRSHRGGSDQPLPEPGVRLQRCDLSTALVFSQQRTRAQGHWVHGVPTTTSNASETWTTVFSTCLSAMGVSSFCSLGLHLNWCLSCLI